jgi:hypothetical protein
MSGRQIAHSPVQRKQGVQVLSGWPQSQWQAKADKLSHGTEDPNRRPGANRSGGVDAAREPGGRSSRAAFVDGPGLSGGSQARVERRSRMPPVKVAVQDAE